MISKKERNRKFILRKAIEKYCGSDAICKKYVEASIKNFLKPEIKLAYKCTCAKNVIVRRRVLKRDL